jgi:hypothetical protein
MTTRKGKPQGERTMTRRLKTADLVRAGNAMVKYLFHFKGCHLLANEECSCGMSVVFFNWGEAGNPVPLAPRKRRIR